MWVTGLDLLTGLCLFFVLCWWLYGKLCVESMRMRLIADPSNHHLRCKQLSAISWWLIETECEEEKLNIQSAQHWWAMTILPKYNLNLSCVHLGFFVWICCNHTVKQRRTSLIAQPPDGFIPLLKMISTTSHFLLNAAPFVLPRRCF